MLKILLEKYNLKIYSTNPKLRILKILMGCISNSNESAKIEMEHRFLGKTKKKELAFFIQDPEKQIQFLQAVRKKVTMVNLNIELKASNSKIRLTLAGTYESLRYAVALVKQIQNSLGC